MWYMGWTPNDKSQHGARSVCYAVSTDGVHWKKPHLGLVEVNGSKKNNILPSELYDSGTVIIDPIAPANSRYKMLVVRNWGKSDAGIYLYESPDGLNFKLNPTRLLDLWPDTHNQVFYDARIKRYVAYLRTWRKRSELPYGEGGPLPHRTVGRIEIDNLLSDIRIVSRR